MDRHDLSETVTAEAVAKAHQEDLKIQHQFGCKGLTYWFDENRKTAFCLVEAPEMKAVSEMHNKAHGMIPNQIIEVDSNVVNAFLGRIGDPKFQPNSFEAGKNIINESAHRTILISKISDFATLKAKYGKNEAKLFADFYNELIRNLINQNGGREVKRLKGGSVISFSASSKAINCAKKILAEVTNQYPYFQITIGLNSGPPVTDNQEFFGETIRLAQRLCDTGKIGHIMISFEIKKQLMEESPGIFANERIVALNKKDEEFLNDLSDVTESNWNETGFDVNSLCRKLMKSKAHLYRKLTALCGHSIHNFIKEYRLEKAIESFEKQEGNVAEIAYKCGFSSPSYFSKCFLERFGILPSAFVASLEAV
jgi:AraC-like DNA-binding protein